MRFDAISRHARVAAKTVRYASIEAFFARNHLPSYLPPRFAPLVLRSGCIKTAKYAHI